MKNKPIKVSWILNNKIYCDYDFGLFPAHKENTIQVDKILWERYVDVRYRFEILHKELIKTISLQGRKTKKKVVKERSQPEESKSDNRNHSMTNKKRIMNKKSTYTTDAMCGNCGWGKQITQTYNGLFPTAVRVYGTKLSLLVGEPLKKTPCPRCGCFALTFYEGGIH